MKTVNRIITGLRGATELAIFFFFLTTSLFLGDGKQPFVDAWWALGILMMYGIRYYQRGRFDLRPLPRLIGWAWVALLLYYVILTPFSDSAGYSITATIQLIEAYLVYMMFATISSERVIALFTKGLLFVGVVATLTSFVFLLLPSLAGFLPPMNLLYATYGHNHLADLLLFIFPIAIAQQSWLILTLFTIGMIFTFARGAWILLVLYLVFLYIKNKSSYLKQIVLVGAAVLVAVFLAVSLLSRNGTSTVLAQKAPQLARLIQKPSLVEDSRWEYWRQAIEAIKERPFFGSGPGTFYLQSKRLQSAPSSYSWFAHSFPLETTVEVGAVGAMLLSLVFIASLRRARASPLFTSLLLALLYGFFEFNLNYTAVWLPLWAILGLSFNDKKNNHQRHQGSRGLAVGGLVVLCVFYVTYISSVALDVVGNKKPAFYIAPYIVSTTKNYLEQVSRDNRKLSLIEERAILKIYKKDPEVLALLAQNMDHQGNVAAGTYYEKSSLLDPYNQDYKKKSFIFSVKNGPINVVGKHVKQWGNELLIGTPQKEASKIDFSSPIFAEEYKTIFSNEAYKPPQTPEALSTLYYQLGLSVLFKEPQRTRELWTLARDSAPDWGYYHVELASLLLYVFRDEKKATIVLTNCQAYQYPAELCRVTLDYLSEAPKPGSFEEKIQEILKRSK